MCLDGGKYKHCIVYTDRRTKALFVISQANKYFLKAEERIDNQFHERCACKGNTRRICFYATKGKFLSDNKNEFDLNKRV